MRHAGLMQGLEGGGGSTVRGDPADVRRTVHWLAVALCAAAMVAALDAWFHRGAADQAVAWSLPSPGYGPATFSAALQASDASIAAKSALLDTFPGEWPREEALARAQLERFRLTGHYEDLAAASTSAVRARSLATDPAGPVLTDAAIALAGHRLAAAEAALAALSRWAVPPPAAELAEARALTADIAFYRGDMERARKDYRVLGATDPAASARRLAMIDKASGRFDEAVANLRSSLESERSPTPFTVASIAMQIGAVELGRGNYREAERRFEEAARIFPGFWVIDAHLAQSRALAGKPREAIERMREIARSSRSAEVMDALAMLLRAYGQPAESRVWSRRAGELWRQRLALAPEAAYGHAIEHELVFGDPRRALGLAQRNLDARPFGESRILLANALIANGHVADALRQLSLAEASGWQSAPLFALRAQALALAGREAEAEQARNAATALNPRILDAETALVWFSHG